MCLLVIFIAAAAGLFAQPSPTDPEYVVPKNNPFTAPVDLQAGEKVFLGQCAGCHGPKGEGGRGGVLAKPRLRHAPDDESLFPLIRGGIKGTEMPAAYALDTRESWQVAAYVRSLGNLPQESVPRNAQRGKEIFHSKGNCTRCYIVGGEGGSLGPELTDIGARRSSAHLRAAVLDPESQLPEGFLRVTTNDGRRLTGLRLNEDTVTIQIRDLNGQLHSFLKQDLRELQKDSGQTPMPRFRTILSASETNDLVAYLVGVRAIQVV